MFSQDPPIPVINEPVYLFIDPAAGGPQSDYAMLSVTRQKGMLTVCCPAPELTTARADNRRERERERGMLVYTSYLEGSACPITSIWQNIDHWYDPVVHTSHKILSGMFHWHALVSHSWHR
jgi:hypothetical protein